MKSLIQIQNKMLEWIKENIKFIFIDVILGIIIYSMMISGNLVNSVDGVWNTSQYWAKTWETSLGRGILYFVDKMRAGLVSMPLNTVLALFCISSGGTLVLDIFQVRSKWLGRLVCLLFIINPVTCITLSYCFTSVGYGVGFLCSVIAVCCIYSKYWIQGMFFGGCFIALSLGCYQAYLGVTCVLLLVLLIKMFIRLADVKEIAAFLIKSVVSFVIGGIFYAIMSKLLLIIFNAKTSSYKGASNLSLGKIIISLPVSLGQCFYDFYAFFIKNKMYIPVPRKVFTLIWVIILILCICLIRTIYVVWRRKRVYAIAFLGCIMFIPIASCAVLLIAVGNSMNLLMSMSMVICIPLFLALLMGGLNFAKEEYNVLSRNIGYTLLIFLLWANILTVTNDQLALKEGRTATVKLTDMIISELVAEGHLEEGAVFAF